jgi:hypothetical protein
MKTKLCILMAMVSLSGFAQAPFTPVFLPGDWPVETWWTNVPPLEHIYGSNSWLAVNYNFLQVSNSLSFIQEELDYAGTLFLTGNETITLSGDATGTGTTAVTVTVTNIQPPGAGSTGQPLRKTSTGVGFGTIPVAAVSGLGDAQTNSVLNSFRVPMIVSNNIVIAEGATNLLGTVTNFAGCEFVYPVVNVTNTGGSWMTNGPLLLYSFDGATWSPGVAGLVTNVAVQIAFYSGSKASNPPTMQIPLPGIVTNFVAYGLVRPDLFGITNATFGEILLVQDPTQPQQAASKNYIDGLISQTAWWSAQNDLQLNGFNLNLSSTWQQATDSLTNSSAYHLRFLGQDMLTVTSPQAVSISGMSIITTNSTNLIVKIPTNGVSVAPRLELSHVPSVWSVMTNLPSVVGTNYYWLFRRPYDDMGFLLGVVPSTNPPALQVSGVLDLRAFSAVTTNLSALRIWNSNNSALFARGTNGVDKLLTSW